MCPQAVIFTDNDVYTLCACAHILDSHVEGRVIEIIT